MTDRDHAFSPVATERLVLRMPTEADLDAIYEIHGDPETNRYNPHGPHRDRAHSRRLLDEWVHHWRRHGFGYWTVLDREEQRVLGFCGIRHETWLERGVLNLYYRFGTHAWGQGYAAEAARCAVELGTKHLPDIPVLARVRPDNVPSLRTAAAAGLTRRLDLDATDDSGEPAAIFTSH